MSYVKHNFQDGQVLTGEAMAEIDEAVFSLDQAVRTDLREVREDLNATLGSLEGVIRRQYLLADNLITGKYWTYSSGQMRQLESSAQKCWAPIRVPAGTYTYLRVVEKYCWIDNGSTVSKLGTGTTNSSPITVTFATPVTLYISASTTSAGNNAMWCNGQDVPSSYTEGIYGTELARIDAIEARLDMLEALCQTATEQG